MFDEDRATQVAAVDGAMLSSSWGTVLHCVSRLERLRVQGERATAAAAAAERATSTTARSAAAAHAWSSTHGHSHGSGSGGGAGGAGGGGSSGAHSHVHGHSHLPNPFAFMKSEMQVSTEYAVRHVSVESRTGRENNNTVGFHRENWQLTTKRGLRNVVFAWYGWNWAMQRHMSTLESHMPNAMKIRNTSGSAVGADMRVGKWVMEAGASAIEKIFPVNAEALDTEGSVAFASALCETAWEELFSPTVGQVCARHPYPKANPAAGGYYGPHQTWNPRAFQEGT